jgi:hypothetical protein
MAIPPKKPGAGRPQPGKPAPKPTTAARRPATAAPTGRAAAPAAPKNNMPLILGISGGALVLLIILAVVFMGGEDPKPEKTSKTKEAKVEGAKKAPPPDVSGLEATGKSKCDEGQRLIQPRLSPDPSAPKDRVRNDLEAGIKLLTEGLDAYKKATTLAGKKYSTDDYQRLRDRAIKIFCTELETEGHASCTQGVTLIQSCAGLMTGKTLSDDEKTKLTGDLQKGKTLISDGMGLLSRASAVSGNTFETNSYIEALKVSRAKLGELR